MPLPLPPIRSQGALLFQKDPPGPLRPSAPSSTSSPLSGPTIGSPMTSPSDR